MTAIDFTDEGLNDRQLEAVTSLRTNMLIYAGAGSGKTRVLVHRIAYLLEVEKLPPMAIMAVTFTNKAAGELKERIVRLLGGRHDLTHMQVGTFHSICSRILRMYCDQAGLPRNYSILDSGDQLALIKRIINQEQLAVDKNFPKENQGFINRMKELGLRAGDCGKLKDPKIVHRPMFETHLKLYRQYEEFCANAGVADFAELILRTCELLENHPGVRARFHNQLQEILVDEFQDTNDIQVRLIMALKSDEAHVTAVGDDDQSIYTWRGANPDNLLGFSKRLSDVKVVKLEQNYRSTGAILNVANDIIAPCQRVKKNLWTDRGEGGKVCVYAAIDGNAEAGFAVKTIRYIHEHENIPYSEFAILYRNNYLSLAFENAMRASDISYKVVGGLKFYDRLEIKDTMAYVRLLVNPQDDAAFARIVNVPARGIGAKSIESLLIFAQEMHQPLLAAAGRAIETGVLRGKARAGLQSFLDTMNLLRDTVEGMKLEDALPAVLDKSGLKTYFAALDASEKDVGKQRTSNLEELVSNCASYGFSDGKMHFGLDALSWFLMDMTLQTGEDEQEEMEGVDSADQVNLMTIHAAKGLEFNTVFVVAMEEGILPSARAMQNNDISEEQRLAYVAVTRAQRHCFLSYTGSRMIYGQYKGSAPSSFLELIQKSNLQYVRSDRDLDSIFKIRRAQTAGFDARQARRSPPAGAQGAHDAEPEIAAPKPKMVDLTDGRISAAELDYRVGDRVFHQKFGEGVVTSINLDDTYSKVTVEFADGRRVLCPRFAALKKLPGGGK